MILSICMMVKNEERNLKRCLDGLKPLMRNLESELIIVDTGSTDHTVDIAKTYTERVYLHPWNNHFSEMRNITISYATGEWILVIDADEELTDGTDMISFLNDPKQRVAYNGCAIQIASFTNLGNKQDKVMIALPRLFKNDGFFHFKGKIHEQPQWKDSPNGIFNLNSLFKHYGYDHADKGLMELKFQRSRRLLEEELTKNPDNIYYRYQLSNTYGMYGQTDKALEEIRKTYHLMAKQKRHRRLLITVYERYTSYAIDQNHLEEAEKICLEGIDLEPEYVDLHFILARLYASQGRDSAAIKSYQDYLELIGRYDRLKIVNDPSIPIYYSNKSDEAMLDLSKLYCRTEDYNSSMQITEQLIGAGSDLPTPVLEQGLAVYVEAALKSKKFSKLKELYLSLAKLEGKNIFWKSWRFLGSLYRRTNRRVL